MSFFLIVISYILITRLKIKISSKTDQQNTDNVLPLKFDYSSVYSNINANITTFELLNVNLLCCTYVRRIQHKWRPLNQTALMACSTI
jgi:preprotein translocase subunit SecY